MHGHEAWIIKAISDLTSARKLLKDDDETLDMVAYHSQQCAEKALKAYLIFRGLLVPKIHDLERLLELCAKQDQSFKKLLDQVLVLMPYATYSRYPDDRFFMERVDAEDALARASMILKFVKRKINEPSDPNLSIFE